MARLTNTRKTIIEELDSYLETSKSKGLFTATITILFIIIFLIFGIIPAFSETYYQYEKNIKLDQVIQNLNNKKKLLETLIEEKNQNQELIDLFNDLFTDGLIQENYIKEVFSIVEQLNIKLTNIVFNITTNNNVSTAYNVDSNKVSLVTMNLNLLGERSDVVKFINIIENSRRIYTIENIGFIRLDDVQLKELKVMGYDDPFSTNLSINIFYWNKI